MNPEQAIAILLQAAERALLTKADHVTVEHAAKIIREALAAKPNAE